MKGLEQLLDVMLKERPVGSEVNNEVVSRIEQEALELGYNVKSLPFHCNYWVKGKSSLSIGIETCEILTGPFAKALKGTGELVVIRTVEELEQAELKGKILLLQGEIAKEPLMPKDYPFYYPDEHKHIIDLLELKEPMAIVANTGKAMMSGLNPFPMFEDGSFSIPSAYTNQLGVASHINNKKAYLEINSEVSTKESRQLVMIKSAASKSKGIIVICAHMDTKYDTCGALDNGAGVAVMLEMMKVIKKYQGEHELHFVPFNGEEYYEAIGELEYLKDMEEKLNSVKLVINIDSPCHIGAQTAVSTYNFSEEFDTMLEEEMKKNQYIVKGQEWYAGDHAMFVFRQIPCIAVTSSDLFEAVVDVTHTDKDTIDLIDCNMITETAQFLAELLQTIR